MKTKLLLLIGIFIISSSLVFGAVGDLKQFYTSPTTNTDTYFGYDNTYYGQWFNFTQANSTYYLGNITLKMKKQAAGTADICVYLTTGDGTKTVLNKSTCINAANLTTSFVDYNFSFISPYLLQSGVTYGIALNATATSTTNYYRVARDNRASWAEGYYNNAMTYTKDYYNGTAGKGVYFLTYEGATSSVTTAYPTFVSPSPPNNARNNTQVTFNLSCSNANRYYLWFNYTKVLDNSTTSYYTTNVSIEYNYTVIGACYNSSATGISANTTQYWAYDITFPTITINSNNAFSSTNYTQINPYRNNMTLNLTFRDNYMLYGYLINVTRSGISYYNISNTTVLTQNYTFYHSINTSSWTDGIYNIQVLAADTHTAKAITNYQVTSKKSSITFKTPNENNIKIETRETSDISTEKQLDRYVFKINFSDGLTKTRSFDVKTDKCPLTYLPNSQYKGHFISLCSLEEGGNWIDFEGVSGVVTVSKSDDYHYVVNITNVPSYVEFKSIGGLNEYEANYVWYKGSYVLTASSSGITEPTNITLNISKDSTTHQYSFGYMVYNVTTYNPVYQINGSTSTLFYQNFTSPATNQTYNLYFIINLTLLDNSSLSLNFSTTHLVFDYGFYNCTDTDGNKSITYYFYDEDNPSTLVNTTMKLDATIWISNPAIFKNYSHLYSGGNNYTLCFYPINQVLYADIYNQHYTVANLTHRYYLFNKTISNTTQANYSLYNFLTTTGLSDLRLIVRNTQYDYMSEVLVKLQRFYVDEGVWRVVQEDLSGDYGLTFFDIYEINQDYKISYYDTSGNLYKTTTSLKFSCTNGICDVTALLDESAISQASQEIEVTTSFNNATKILTINWNDDLLLNNNIQIFVTKETLSGTVNICNIYQTGSSGTTTCNLTGYTGDVFVQVSQANSPYKPIFSELITLARQTIANLVGQEDGALWTFGIMLSIIGFGVFSPVGAVMATVVGVFVIFVLGFFNPINLTFLIITAAMAIAIGLKVRQ